MVPVIFKEQFSQSSDPASTSTVQELSLVEYKIDFNDYLGDGCWGVVYGVVKRPENEKTILAKWFPYQYDFLFRLNSSEKQPTGWCIKISKSFLTIAVEHILEGNDMFLGPVIWSFYEKQVQLTNNQLLQQYRMTNLVFPQTSNYYAQFKTRVRGNTLRHYLHNNDFINPEHYFLRRAYVFFIWKIDNVLLELKDLDLNNVMYDEISHQIEIVDGVVNETDTRGGNYLRGLGNFDAHQGRVLQALERAAQSVAHYTQQFDEQLLESTKEKPHKPSYEFHSTRDFAQYSMKRITRSTVVNVLRGGGNLFRLFHHSTKKELLQKDGQMISLSSNNGIRVNGVNSIGR